MKKMRIICLIFCLLLTFIKLPAQGSAPETVHPGDTQSDRADEDTIMVNSYHGINAETPLLGTKQLVENARAAVLYEANSDTLMYAWNADTQMYPASFVKIMTAWIAAEKGDLTDTVVVTEGAVASVPLGAVTADLLAGEILSLQDLLYCLLVGSANDAAAVIAEHISGDQASFVQEMNRYALELGCTGTQFKNAHGLHDDAQYTTARDSAQILSVAMKNEVFRKIFTATRYTVAATNKSEARELTTGNFLMDTSSKLYYDSRVIGGRTGVTDDGRRCLAAAAENNGMLLISVVMGAESVYQEDGYSAVSIGGYKETTTLLDAGFDGNKMVQVLFANQTLRQSTVPGGDCDVVLGPRVSVSTVLPEGASASDLVFQYSDEALSLPIEAGQRLSRVQVWHGTMCVAQADLFAMNAVRPKNASQPDTAAQQTGGNWVIILWIVLGAVIGIFVLLFVLRFISKMRLFATKKRSRQYRRSRRRSR